MTRAPDSPQKRSSNWGKLLTGVSFIAAESAVAPLDRVRLLMQSQGHLVHVGRLADPYKVRPARGSGWEAGHDRRAAQRLAPAKHCAVP
jgi:hypothetical protein